ncbi:MAG: hypothetical protein IJZ61_03275 [Oscillospiraceae bacterium]|nr:hypothetical protein [Oscillospiraceae bacterium]
MKITAHFNSPDSADFAAGALKRTLSPLTKIETENRHNINIDTGINIFPVFNLASITPTYSVPVRRNNSSHTNSSEDCVLRVICRKEEAAEASRIIIGFGGRNITKI